MARRGSSPHPDSEPIRLVVVEPHPLLAAGVRQVIDREDGIEVVAETRSPAEAIPVVGEVAPDVILVDLPPEEPAAAEATRQLRREMPNAAILLIGGDDGPSIVEALELGATGRVADRAAPEELVATIRRVAEGDDPLKDEIAGRPDVVEAIVDAVRQSIVAEDPTASLLSPRELEVLGLVARGHRNREIAAELGISTQTVKNHVTATLHKLGVPNRTRAVTYAMRQGWLALDGERPMESAAAVPDLPGS